MFKKYGYFLLLAFTGILLLSIFIFSEEETVEIPALQERKGEISLSGEWLNTKAAIEGLLASIERNPKDYKSKLSLAQAYIQESRITGNHAYYDKAANILLDDIIKHEPNNFTALCSKATVLLSQHHFNQGLEIAKQAYKLNPNSAFVQGIMCDANVELGHYDEAIEAGDKMVSLRPDIRSYSRISYLREIHGDLKGAIEAAKLAVSAGYPGLEQSVWSRVILAQLYEKTGALDSAKFQYQYALAERPGYAHATAGLAKLKQNSGDIDAAIALYIKAKENVIDYALDEALYMCHKEKGDDKTANKYLKEVINQLIPLADVDESERGHGHYADKELADIYCKANELKLALKHAKIEYDRRPENIDVNLTLAWIYYLMNDGKTAKMQMLKAMKTGCKNPEFLVKNALITGDLELIDRVLPKNMYLEPDLLEAITSKMPS